ncbi:sensor domain-containing diguanylate cyclase [Saccharibacillus alkalitolerans]|uniref:Diguanylate cyclase n=1 Tax=Saccharibacillus alkalitolerans TaxID=2705290 RepID=A0ABX0FA17_9BACL|nr:diguanylate cyclase [Saccharibacillus alkalitolerans]NGZ77776.1 diguanylate cyclase [Saccharibacillus alkalitolerans]
MIQLSFNLGSLTEAHACLENDELQTRASCSRSVLVQFFASSLDPKVAVPLAERIHSLFPQAVVTGITTSGEIYEGEVVLGRTIAVFSFFETTELIPVAFPCRAGEEEETGRRLAAEILEDREVGGVKGILLYATTQRMDGAGLLVGMREALDGIPVFGAGAGSYVNNGEAWIFACGRVYENGVAAVAFRGPDLEIEIHPYLGWEPLSRGMTVTGIEEPTLITTLDGIPAAEVYEKYLSIPNDESFFENMLEFPLMLQRGGSMLARVPISRGENGSLRLAADVRVGEQIRLGYGNPKHIVIDAYDIQEKIGAFQPQGILLYSCYCRQIYLQDAVNLETRAFQKFAPASGIYTYGEFHGQGEGLQLHNATMIAVGMREGGKKEAALPRIEERIGQRDTKQMEMTSRLARFVGAVVEEWESVNRELQEMMQTDSLTGLYNRRKMDELLNDAIKENGGKLAIILLDIDRFKRINDECGHLCGDAVLQRAAKILRLHEGENGTAGRWGGEEFLLLLRHTGLEEAEALAERIRADMERTDFGKAGRVTGSFGVTAAEPGEGTRQIFKRADEALYAAKHGGRNRVVAQ